MERKKLKEKRKERNKKIRDTLILIIILFIVIVGTEIIWFYFKFFHNVKAIQVYDMKVKVSDYIGFNIENTSLNFGAVMPESGSYRFVEISSDEDVKVEIFLTGSIAKWVKINKNDFILVKGKKEKISFYISVPANAKYGNYTGKAIIILRKI